MTPGPGERTGLVSGRFRLGLLLGSGGSASVFAAVDTTTGETVALKVLHPHLSERPAAREAFLDEAARARGLVHPNIAGVIEVGVDLGADEASVAPVAWIALELAEGESLAEHVVRSGRLPVASALAVGVGVARALEAAHAAGLVHRDVSPANVMVDAAESAADGAIEVAGVRLLDFGLADAAGRAAVGGDVVRSADGTGAEGVIGNVGYLSPEQALGRPVDERGDVYQAGAVLYFALTGRAPFVRPTPAETVRAHLDAPPPVPSVLDPAIPRALDRIVVRAMLKDPDDRYATARELREDLDAVAAATGEVEAAPATGVTRVLGATSVPGRADGARPSAAISAPASVPERDPKPPPSATRSAGQGLGVAAAIAGVVAVIAIAAAIGAQSTDVPAPSASPSASPSSPLPPPPAADEVEEQPAEPSHVELPQLAMRTLAEARAALASLGLAEGTLTVVESEQPGDTVLTTSPAAGDRVEEGGAVSLTVASGSNRVPDVTGAPVSLARADLERAGFSVVVEGGTDGTVSGSVPATGAIVRLGTTVVLRVVRSTPVPTPTPTPPPIPPATPIPTPTPGVRSADRAAGLATLGPALLPVDDSRRSHSPQTLTTASGTRSERAPLRSATPRNPMVQSSPCPMARS